MIKDIFKAIKSAIIKEDNTFESNSFSLEEQNMEVQEKVEELNRKIKDEKTKEEKKIVEERKKKREISKKKKRNALINKYENMTVKELKEVNYDNLKLEPYRIYKGVLRRKKEEEKKFNEERKRKRRIEKEKKLDAFVSKYQNMLLIELQEIKYTSFTQEQVRIYKNLLARKEQLQKEQEKGYILSTFNPVEGGETTLYYLRLKFKDKNYYKIGVTLNSVKDRYNQNDFKFIDKILYEKKLTHARTIEQQIIKQFKNKVFPLSILSSGVSEIFDQDILRLDL